MKNYLAKYINEKKLYKRVQEIYNDRMVRRGSFKGLKYPDFISTGSTLYPKLAGVYEKEISEIILKSLAKQYEYFIDVGCAEGYYAVGMAKFGRCEKVIAYDINRFARKLCNNMAIYNNINVEIEKELTAKALGEIKFDKEKVSFLMVDCEGFERKLFTRENISNLSNVECLIEVHDWCQYDNRTADILCDLFKKTHRCKFIYGIDDYDKAYSCQLEELEDFTVEQKKCVLKEGRRRLAVWFHCVPKIETGIFVERII